MSRSQGPQKPSFPFGNLFRAKLPKGSYMSPRLLDLVNKFEESLAGRLVKLIPKDNEAIFSLSWMILAIQLLSETHNDIKTLITDLELPVYKWDEKWIDVYLGNSVKLLDICIAFSSEISRLSQGRLLLQCLLHDLDSDSPKDFVKTRFSLDSWWQHIGSRNPRVENSCSTVDQLVLSLGFPKIKDSAKGKVLMQAMYGVRVQTILLCSVVIGAFRGSAEKVVHLEVTPTHLWAQAYADLQWCVHKEVSGVKPSNILIKELEAVDESANVLLSLCKEGNNNGVDSKETEDSLGELSKRTEILSGGLDVLAKEVDGFFQIVLGGRDALIFNLRTEAFVEDPKKELKMK